MLNFATWLESDQPDIISQFRAMIDAGSFGDMPELCRHAARFGTSRDIARFNTEIVPPLYRVICRLERGDPVAFAHTGQDVPRMQLKLIKRGLDTLRDIWQIPEELFPDERPKFYPSLH